MPLAWLMPASARLGWLTTRVACPEPEQARGFVYLFRGTGVAFSSGFAKLCGQFRSAGIWAEDLRSVGDRWAVSHVLRQREQGLLQGPVILIGHSRGGRRALVAAKMLEHAGINVDLLICVDVALPPPVPANVRRAVHLYRGHRRVYPVRPLSLAPHATGRVDNIDLDQPGAPFPGLGLNHLNITGSPALRGWIEQEVCVSSTVR